MNTQATNRLLDCHKFLQSDQARIDSIHKQPIVFSQTDTYSSLVLSVPTSGMSQHTGRVCLFRFLSCPFRLFLFFMHSLLSFLCLVAYCIFYFYNIMFSLVIISCSLLLFYSFHDSYFSSRLFPLLPFCYLLLCCSQKPSSCQISA